MGLKHAFKSEKPDPADSTIIGATKWNDDHYMLDSSETPVGALGDILYRGTDGLVSLITGAQGLLASAGSGQVPAYTMTPTVTTVTYGAVTIDATDAGKIDGITDGTAAASKALVVDSNIDIGGIRNLTATGIIATPVINGSSHVLEQYSGTDAQTYRIYNTRASATSFERAKFAWESNEFRIFTEAGGGGGSARNMAIGTAGAGAILTIRTANSERWRFDGSGHFIAVTDNTYDFGATAATRARSIYYATTLHGQYGGGVTALFGADSGASTLTNSTDKVARIGTPHYTTSEEPMALIIGVSDSGNNSVRIGGASSAFNAATDITFYTAANTTTTTGTGRWSINSSGHFVAFADNTYDIGADGASRPRSIYAGTLIVAPTIQVGPTATAATGGSIRLVNTAIIAARNAANNANIRIAETDASDYVLIGSSGGTGVIVGSAASNSRMRSDLNTPASLANGDWWVECTGSSPSRVCAIKVRDGGATRTIASVTY